MEFKKGIKDSIPVGLGYFAVSFSLGIIAKNVGLSPIQGFLTSLFINASAGEYAVNYKATLYADGGAFQHNAELCGAQSSHSYSELLELS